MNIMKNLMYIFGTHNDYELIKMYFKENAFNTRNAIVIMANNSAKESFCISPGFILDKYENGEWITVAGWGTQEMSTFIQPFGTIEFTIEWTKEYKELESGRYRLLKEYTSNDGKGVHENFKLEFEI